MTKNVTWQRDTYSTWHTRRGAGRFATVTPNNTSGREGAYQSVTWHFWPFLNSHFAFWIVFQIAPLCKKSCLQNIDYFASLYLLGTFIKGCFCYQNDACTQKQVLIFATLHIFLLSCLFWILVLGGNSLNFLCKFVIFFVTFRCFYKAIIHRKSVIYVFTVVNFNFFWYLHQKLLTVIIISWF